MPNHPTPGPSPWLVQRRERGGETQSVRVEMYKKCLALVIVHSPLPPLLQPGGGAGGGVNRSAIAKGEVRRDVSLAMHR